MREIIICHDCKGEGKQMDRFTQTLKTCLTCDGKRILVKTTLVSISKLGNDERTS